LRGYGQRDPLVEYKREGFDLFAEMMGRVQSDVIGHLMRVQPMPHAPPSPSPAPQPASQPASQAASMSGRAPQLIFHRGEAGQEPASAAPVHRNGEKVGRNDPCPCGSGKKFKKCCGSRA
jgi:preprotein translocase subunit SecA